jgi:hypothetical protein
LIVKVTTNVAIGVEAISLWANVLLPRRVLDMGRGSVEALESILGCTLAEARAVYIGPGSPTDFRDFPPWDENGLRSRAELDRGGPEKWLVCRGSGGADEGTRTLDLLHGKRHAAAGTDAFGPRMSPNSHAPS